MAISHGTIVGVHVLDGLQGQGGSTLKHAQVLIDFPTTETYAQADGVEILLVGAKLAAWLRNGKTITVYGAVSGPCAVVSTDVEQSFGACTMSAATTLHAHVLTADHSTEYANATAFLAQKIPFSFIVSYTET